MFYIPYSVTSVIALINIYIQYPSFVLNALIIFISIRSVRPSLPRTYCLNISIMCLIGALYTICKAAFENTIFKEYSEKYNTAYVLTVSTLSIMLLQSALNLYLFQATLTILLAYIGFAKPVLYKRLSRTRLFFYSFILSHVLSWILAAGQTLEYFSQQPILKNYNRTILVIHTWARTLVKLTIYAFGHTTHGSGQQSKWLILRSVLIYCTPPNVFAIVGIAGTYCTASEAMIPPTAMRLATTCYTIQYFAEQLILLRLFVTSLSALLAFADYRKALFSIIPRIIRGKGNVVQVTHVQKSDTAINNLIPVDRDEFFEKEYDRVAEERFMEEFGEFLTVPTRCIVLVPDDIDLVETILNAGPRARIDYSNISSPTVGASATIARIIEAHEEIVRNYRHDSRYNPRFERRHENLHNLLHLRVLIESFASVFIQALVEEAWNGQ
ncbi:hypothetical protein QR680_007095 [Steinernema hermaphroditum]|uniref:Uncharacterized protein n=1 Tax=Steinernema hermaphroditum TaxID=289476 RepID=A0AA39LY79_9BILA|nr:hypothetical protein QR680_007095 [Steinernema hermaphroditum]